MVSTENSVESVRPSYEKDSVSIFTLPFAFISESVNVIVFEPSRAWLMSLLSRYIVKSFPDIFLSSR